MSCKLHFQLTLKSVPFPPSLTSVSLFPDPSCLLEPSSTLDRKMKLTRLKLSMSSHDLEGQPSERDVRRGFEWLQKCDSTPQALMSYSHDSYGRGPFGALKGLPVLIRVYCLCPHTYGTEHPNLALTQKSKITWQQWPRLPTVYSTQDTA